MLLGTPGHFIYPQHELVAEGPALQEGEFVERDVLDLRVRVREPMQSGRVFLAGDAAHLVTPAGGKGMNLAIQDAVELAAGLCERYGPAHAGERLARYSDTRLPAVWRYQEFSNLMPSRLPTPTSALASEPTRDHRTVEKQMAGISWRHIPARSRLRSSRAES